MDKIKITWIEHVHCCETCGSSFAYGAIVNMGNTAIYMEPVANCFDSVGYSVEEVYNRILSELGYTVEVVDDVEG